MATAKPVWNRDNNLRTAATLGAAGTADHSIDLSSLGADQAEIQVDIVLGAASSVKVEIVGSVDDGTTKDTTDIAPYEVRSNDRRSIIVGGAHRTLRLTNQDGSNATGNISAKYAWRQWDIT